MPSKTNSIPWHKVVDLRDDLRSGELALATFAADLYDVSMDRGRSVYRDPKEFFSLTYPTFNLRQMVKDVLLRLAGKNDKAVLQLELTYGGGKTHSLITLYHLVHDPGTLPDLPAIQEFVQHAGGIFLPRARAAVISFDKLDTEKGMEVRAPNGLTRWLRHPWSALAYQIAGPEGLKLLHADNKEEERETPPAENLLQELVRWPEREGLSTLILLDEVLMYAREKVRQDHGWRHVLQDFFQCLTQAVSKVDHACIVASLLATDPRKSDEVGKEIAQELYAIFRRQHEQGIQPVEKQDVAEVLRRRFFTPESVKDRERFRSHVVSALEGIQALDEHTQKNRKTEEDRYLASYPFHPDLTEAFYSKWTQLDGFQRTRGVLRTFALALRDAEKWDTSPLITASVFLADPAKQGLSEAARELSTVARHEGYEGKQQDWATILEGELSKARDVQKEAPALKGREVEQAVMATFLHSQPAGQKAMTRDLMVLLGAGKPDRIELEKALQAWTRLSWFLDETGMAPAGDGKGAVAELPKSWRLGTKPNLKQMHSQAMVRIQNQPELIEESLRAFIQKEKRLTAGATQAGVAVHNLPLRPGDVADEGEFHYLVLGPSSASEAGKLPSPEARRYLQEKTGPENPRTYQNAVLAIVPSKDGLEVLRSRIREMLGWEEVAGLPEAKDFDDTRKALLKGHRDRARGVIADSVVQAYNVVVTMSSKGEVEAFRISTGNEPVFETVKKDTRSRIKESAITPEALLPGGPHELWRAGETERRASDIISAFAQFPHLPKMLRHKDIADTLSLGCEQGHFVLRLTRPDKTFRTLWRTRPSETDLKDKDLTVVLPEAAEITHIDERLLVCGALPGLWPDDDSPLEVRTVVEFFDGKHVSKVPRGGYEDIFPIPAAPREVIEEAINEAVKGGLLWLLSGPSSIYKEGIPLGVLTDGATLNPPPKEIPATALLPQNLPAAWSQNMTTAAGLATALSTEAGKPLPWAIVMRAIEGAIQGRLLERTGDSGAWPCDWAGASQVKLRVPTTDFPPPPPPPPSKRFSAEAEVTSGELQDLADNLSELIKAAAGLDLSIVLRLELGDDAKPTPAQLAKLNEVLRSACGQLQFMRVDKS